MRIPVPGNIADFLPPLPKPDTSPYELNPRNIATSKTLKAPKTVSSAEDYRNARKAIAARSKAKTTTKSPSGSGGSSASFDGVSDFGAGGLDTGGGNPYLDVINSLKDQKNFTDYLAEANKIYKPSLDYITGLEKSAEKRAGQYDKNLAGMYEALVGDINAQQPVIQQNYDSAIANQNQITSGAKQAVGSNYANSQAQQMAMLKQLGIEAAAPETLQTGQDSQAFFQSLLDTSGAGYDQFLNSQRVAAQDFNTAQSNIAAQTGTNARADLQMQLQDILAQYGGKRADLQTQINQQAVEMQSGAAKALLDQAKLMLDAVRYNNDDQMDQANLKLNYDRLAQEQEAARGNLEARLAEIQQRAAEQTAKANAPAKVPSNPWGNAAQIADQLYNNDTAESNALRAIQDTIRLYPDLMNYPNSSKLLDKVLSRVSPNGKPTGQGDTAALQTLVDYIYKQLKSS